MKLIKCVCIVKQYHINILNYFENLLNKMHEVKMHF